jgi:hypothetical protein
MGQVGRRFWIEATLGCISAVLLAVTLAWPDWVELVFGVEPDGGDGTFEWLTATLSAVSWLTFSALAAIDYRRARAGDS